MVMWYRLQWWDSSIGLGFNDISPGFAERCCSLVLLEDSLSSVLRVSDQIRQNRVC